MPLRDIGTNNRGSTLLPAFAGSFVQTYSKAPFKSGRYPALTPPDSLKNTDLFTLLCPRMDLITLYDNLCSASCQMILEYSLE
jgi:hypothetical protein